MRVQECRRQNTDEDEYYIRYLGYTYIFIFKQDDEGTGALSYTRELPLTTIIVIAASGTCMTVFICFTVCLVVFCRGKGTKSKKSSMIYHQTIMLQDHERTLT